MQTINYTHEGVTYEAEWDFLDDDNIAIYLPNGIRETWLGGLNPDHVAMQHLVTYVHTQHPKK